MDQGHEDLFAKINMICHALKESKKKPVQKKVNKVVKTTNVAKKSISKSTKSHQDKKSTTKTQTKKLVNNKKSIELARSTKSSISTKARSSPRSTSTRKSSVVKSRTSSPKIIIQKTKIKTKKSINPPQVEKQNIVKRRSALIETKKVHSNDEFLISQLKFKYSITLQRKFFRLWAVNYFHSIHRTHQRNVYCNLQITTNNELSLPLQSDSEEEIENKKSIPCKLSVSESYDKNLEIHSPVLSTSPVKAYPHKGISVSQSVSEMFRQQKASIKESSIQNQVSMLKKLAASSDEEPDYEEEIQKIINNADRVLQTEKMRMLRINLKDEETQSVASIGSDLDISKRPLYQDETDSSSSSIKKSSRKQNTRVASIRQLKANYEQTREDFSEIAASIKDIDVSPETILKRSDKIITNYEATSHQDPKPPKINLHISSSSKLERPETTLDDVEGDSYSDRIASLLGETNIKKPIPKEETKPKQKPKRDDGVCRAPPKPSQDEKQEPNWDKNKTTMFSASSESDFEEIEREYDSTKIMSRVNFTGSLIEKEVEQRRKENQKTIVDKDEYNLGEEDYGASIVGMDNRLPKQGQRINLSTDDLLSKDSEIAEKLEQLQQNVFESEYDSIDEVIKLQKSKNPNQKISVCGIELSDSDSDGSFLEMRN